MNHLVARLRVRALGMATRLVPAPTPLMFTGPRSSTQLVRMIADRGARSTLVVSTACVLYGVCSLWIFRLEFAGSRSQTLSLGEGGRRSRRAAALALALSAAG